MHQVFASNCETNSFEKNTFVAFIRNVGNMACIDCPFVEEERGVNIVEIEQFK
jgi:hypothetical protein